MKKAFLVTALCIMSTAAFTACGSTKEAAPAAATEAVSEAAETTVAATEEAVSEDTSVEEVTTEEATDTAAQTGVEEDAAVFGDKVKDVFAAKDINALADMMAYPGYVGLGEGIEFQTKEEFLAINPDELFTQELMDAVAACDTSALTETGAGYVMGEQAPDVIFGAQADGSLAITGINY